MTGFKGTPGPWAVRESSLGVSVVCPNGEVVFHESDKRMPGVMGDAHLIAAAPELLEALDELANGYAGNRWDVGLMLRLEKARAAIAKALGETK